jgi:hypothetical protein
MAWAFVRYLKEVEPERRDADIAAEAAARFTQARSSTITVSGVKVMACSLGPKALNDSAHKAAAWSGAGRRHGHRW